MDKGTRVEITGGRQGVGQTGTIFWKGPNKFGPGERFGVRGDDGSTYWVLEDDVSESSAAAPVVPESSETYEKGDRVELKQRGQTLTGTVFWTGQSKTGTGQRLGVKTDGEEETVWIDAGFVSRSDSTAPAPSSPGPSNQGYGDGDEDAVPDEYRSVGEADLPPMAPIDDASIEQMAYSLDEEDDGRWA